MALTTLVPPASEPVTLAMVKQFARVDFPDDDTLWPGLIAAARERCEIYTQRRFIQRTMRLQMDFFPGYVDFKMAGQKVSSPFVSGSNAILVGIRYAIALPYPTVRQVIQLQYLDSTGTTQTLVGAPAHAPNTAGANYLIDLDSKPARLSPNVQAGQMWPVAMVTLNAVWVDFVTGYGANLAVTLNAGDTVVSSTAYNFQSTDVGRQIAIPGAGAGGATLGTTVQSVASGAATLAAAAATAVIAVTAYLGEPVPQSVQVAILRLALAYYEYRTSEIPESLIKSILQQLRNVKDERL